MSTPIASAAMLINETGHKQQYKQVIAQSYLLLKDAAKMAEFLDDLLLWMNSTDPTIEAGAKLRTNHRLALTVVQWDELKADFDGVDQNFGIKSLDDKLAAKQAYLTKRLYDDFRNAIDQYIISKQATEAYKLSTSPPLKKTPSQLGVKFSGLLGKLPKSGEEGYPSDPLASDAFTHLFTALDSDPDLKAFLAQRVERAGAGEPDADPTQDPTVTLGNKFYREYQDRKGAGPPNPFLKDLEDKAQKAGMIRSKDPITGNWSGNINPNRTSLSFVERRENYRPTGQPHADPINLIVARDIGLSTPELIALINTGAPKMPTTHPSAGEPNPCVIKFTDSKTTYRLIAQEEFGQIIPYKIKEADFDDWKTKGGMQFNDPRVKKMSGEDCLCKIDGNPARTAADDFAEMFVALADLNLKNVHTNIKAPVAAPQGPAAGMKVTQGGQSPTQLTSNTSNISKRTI